MSFALDTNQLKVIREPYQASDLYLSLYEPVNLFCAQLLTGTTYDIGTMELPFYNVVTGTYLDFEKGQTVLIGTQPYLGDIGRVRLISGTPIQLKVAPDKTIPYEGNMYLTVQDFHEIWTVQPKAVLVDPNNPKSETIFYKDFDISYSNQNSVFEPVVNMGGNYAGFYSGTSSMTYFSASGSFAQLSSIDKIVWQFPTGSSQFIVTGTTPGWINLPTTPGHYTVKCTVYATNGKTATGYRHYSLYNNNYQPIGDWQLKELTANLTDGWLAKITVGENAYRFKDGALCVIFAKNQYGNNEVSFGRIPGQETVLFSGYVSAVNNVYDAFTNSTDITIRGTSLYLKNKELYSVTTNYAVSPTDWTELSDTSINRIIFHYLRWHTTLLDVCDFYPNTTGQGAIKDQFEDFTKNDIYNSISQITRRVFCNFVSNRHGQTFIDADLNMMLTGTRPASVMQFLDTDWIGKPTYNEIIDKPVSMILMGGVSFDDIYTLTGTAWLSKAPGTDPGMGYTGKSQTIDGLALPNTDPQDYVNEMAGLALAKQNNRYVDLQLSTANYFGNIDIVPQQYFDFILLSGTTYRNTIFNPVRIIPKSIKINFQNQKITQDISFDFESYGKPGESYIMPVDPITSQPGGNDTPTPVNPPGADGGKQTWVTTATKIGYTTNLTANSPHWLNKTSNVTGEIRDFCLDPFNPTKSAYCATKTAIWHTNTADALIPTWIKIFDAIGNGTLQFNSNLAPEITRICSTITLEGRYYFTLFAKQYSTDSVANLEYIYRITNGSYIQRAVSPSNVAIGTHICATSYQYGNALYSGGWDSVLNCAVGAAYSKDNKGDNWIKFYFATNMFIGDILEVRASNSAYEMYLIDLNDNLVQYGLYATNATVTMNFNCKGVYIQQVGFGGYLDITEVYARVNTSIHTTYATVNYSLDAGDHDSTFYAYSDAVNGIFTSRTLSQLANTAYDIECPYANNPEDYIIYFWTTDNKLYRKNFNTGVLSGPLLTHDATPPVYLSQRSNTFVGNPNGTDVYALRNTAANTSELKYSNDMGANWVTRATGLVGAHKLGLWPSNVNKVYLLTESAILYSEDGGVTFGNKNGDWATVMGENYTLGNQIVPNWSISE